MRHRRPLSHKNDVDSALSIENSLIENSLDRLYELKDQRYLTKRIFLRVSENMHYEISNI